MKLLKPSPHRARNDFDLSHRHIFSANFGELLPISCIETVPGDHIKVHVSDLLRAIPMVTSPFLRAKQHLDVWFVPYRDLWHQFDAFVTQKSEPVSSAMKDAKFLPHTNLYNIATALSDNLTTPDIVGRNYNEGACKLLNLLGYGDQIVSKFYSSPNTSPSVNPFRIAAYNYIWYNEYRQQYYDDGKYLITSGLPYLYNDSPASLFNFDYLTCDTEANAFVDYQDLVAPLQMRYRLFKKDLYTGLMPSTQFGNVSTITNDVFGKLKVESTPTGNQVLALTTGSSEVVSYNAGTINGNSQNFNVGFDVLQLRKSEAIQIWRENALRAGNHIKDNMEAHYGVSSDFQDHRPRFLGSVSSPLNIGDVMTTANSNYSGNTNPNTNVGDTAGKGLSSLDDKVFTYDAKEFGVIMCMFSILPETEYNAKGIDRMNQLLEAEDFFVPEYENLGLEAVSNQDFFSLQTNNMKVVGYAPRYYGYKQKLDRVFTSFMTTYNGVAGLNLSWASPNYPAEYAMANPLSAIPLSTLYVNPAIYDVNFSAAVSVTDQILCDVYFDVDAVRPMSVVGLPFS